MDQESVDELHTHYKEQMDTIQDEAKKQIKDIEGKYMDAFEVRKVPLGFEKVCLGTHDRRKIAL